MFLEKTIQKLDISLEPLKQDAMESLAMFENVKIYRINI
jgi:hypothetical protein